MRVAITGATGFIGSEIVRELLLSSQASRIYLLVRPHGDASPDQRWARVVAHWHKFAPEIPSAEVIQSMIEIIPCDLEKPGVEHLKIPLVDYFIHSAASTDFHLPLQVARTANLYSTQRAVAIARNIPGLKRFVYMSTAFVSGASTGLISENNSAIKFSNTYEKTKLEAEGCVSVSGLPWTILRPSIVVGHSENGYVWRMKVIYSVTKIWVKGFVKRAPMDSCSRADIVPVDFVTKSTLALMKSTETRYKAIHICSGRLAPKSIDILHCVARVFDIANPLTAPLWYARLLTQLPSPRLLIGDRLASVLEAMRWHLPYLGTRGREFDTRKSENILGPLGITCPDFKEYGTTLFSYCRKTHWGRRPLKDPAKHVLDEVVPMHMVTSDLTESEGKLVFN